MHRGRFKLGIDLDGVLVGFVSGFTDLLCHMAAIDPPEIFAPTKWQWYDELNLGKPIVRQGWKHVEAHPSFWFNLDPLPNAHEDMKHLRNLELDGHDLYFITNRPFAGAKKQSEAWLAKHGFSNPTVLIAESKGAIAKGLHLTHFIDDRPENCTDVLTSMGIRTKVYLYTQSYNLSFNDTYIYRSASVTEMLRKEGLIV